MWKNREMYELASNYLKVLMFIGCVQVSPLTSAQLKSPESNGLQSCTAVRCFSVNVSIASISIRGIAGRKCAVMLSRIH